jgi:hypothetical protein
VTWFERSVDVKGEIRAVHGHDLILLTASRDTVTIDVPHLRLRALLKTVKTLGGKARRVKALGGVSTALHATDLSVHFRLAQKTVAKVGADAHPGPLSRLVGRVVGVAPLEIRPAIIAALFKSRRP